MTDSHTMGLQQTLWEKMEKKLIQTNFQWLGKSKGLIYIISVFLILYSPLKCYSSKKV